MSAENKRTRFHSNGRRFDEVFLVYLTSLGDGVFSDFPGGLNQPYEAGIPFLFSVKDRLCLEMS